MPLINFFKKTSTTRISIAMYNTYNEIDILYKSLLHTIKLLTKLKN
jgi:selenocysteine lyase/cysteine desulfurase